MRRLVKMELIRRIDNITKTIKEIISLYKVSPEIDVFEVVSLTRNEMILIGTRIEDSEGEGLSVIGSIEQMCELLYLIGTTDEDRVENLQNLLALSVEVAAYIYDLPQTKYLYFFLPYKVTMWDSLESIWIAATKDEECEAYVMPIPYCDRKEDGSAGTVHYEGDLYPDYVDVIDFRDVDLSIVQPDVIFIHNPYDGSNIVTSVDPKYYSTELRNVCKQLVYVPYYVTGGSLGGMHSLLPAYCHADCLVMQNKQQITKLDPLISGRAIAMGSPKFDKVINYQVTDDMIPKTWLDKLHTKVFFLNGGLNGLLERGDKSLLKIQSIFKAAEEKNVTILWRPHPLLGATIQSMRPELQDLFDETVSLAQSSSHVIWDDTECPELAIKLSDAYIGEATSSLCHMFGVLGKPLFFLKEKIWQKSDNSELVKINVVTQSIDGYWAMAADRNALFRLNADMEIVKAFFVPNEANVPNLYNDMVVYDNKICLVPFDAKEVAIFNTETENFTKIALEDSKTKAKFNKGYYMSGHIILIPRLYSKLVALNCKKQVLIYDDKVTTAFKKVSGISSIFSAANANTCDGENIYFGMPNKPYVGVYSFKTNKLQILKVKMADDGFCCMAFQNGRIVLGSMNKPLMVIWDVEENRSVEVSILPDEWNVAPGEISFWNMIAADGKVYVFPRKNNQVLEVDVENGEYRVIEMPLNFSLEERKDTYFNHPNCYLMVQKMRDGRILCQDAVRHGLSEFSTEGKLKWHMTKLSHEQSMQLMQRGFARQGANLPWGIFESRYNTVELFIDYVNAEMHDTDQQLKKFATIAENLDGTAGEKIYQATKKMG